MFSVEEVMNSDVLTLEPDSTLQDARLLMRERRIRHIPIVAENNRLVGLVTQRDVLAAADSTLVVAPEDANAHEGHVALSSVMTAEVNTIDEQADLRAVALYMQRQKIGCLPVLRGETLVGIITDTDFVSIAINLLEQLEEREPEELLEAEF